ncbi:cadmium resistance transporter [Egbenema bharatensis]|uniref:cadmium resistance transporter n=1 Tax=Egbenema bharatensis TaxID=3463334 RepID=UPI003A8A497D
MGDLIFAIPTGISAFTATNLDDIVILMLFFSQTSPLFRHRHIISGQYLGFLALIALSLPGFFGSLVLPRPWIGMLGIVPIAIGISRLLDRSEEESDAVEFDPNQSSPWTNVLSPQTLGVAAVTVANGSDNIGIYVPLFAGCTWESLLITLGVFFSLVGVWCYAAYRLTCLPMVANTLTRYGNYAVPFILIGIGVIVLNDSHTLDDRGLLMLSLLVCVGCVISFTRQFARTPEVEKQ